MQRAFEVLIFCLGIIMGYVLTLGLLQSHIVTAPIGSLVDQPIHYVQKENE